MGTKKGTRRCPVREKIGKARCLLGGESLRELALVAGNLVLVDLARLRGLIENRDGLARERLQRGFVSTLLDRGTHLLELILHRGFDPAIFLRAADSLAGAFGGGLGIGHKKVFGKGARS